MDSLRKLGPKRFVDETIKLVPTGMTYNPLGRSPGPGKILSYRAFVEVVSKYMREPTKLDAVPVGSWQGSGCFDIQFVGIIKRSALRPERVWHLPLNDALALGVQPEQIRMFRKHYDLHDDKRFFQIPLHLH